MQTVTQEEAKINSLKKLGWIVNDKATGMKKKDSHTCDYLVTSNQNLWAFHQATSFFVLLFLMRVKETAHAGVWVLDRGQELSGDNVFVFFYHSVMHSEHTV